MNNFTIQIAAMQAALVGQAQQDPALRAELLENPRATVEKVFEVTLPAHIQIQVNEAPANTVVVTLPHAPDVGLSGELSDHDLEAVAGGSKAEADEFFVTVASTALEIGMSKGMKLTHTHHDLDPLQRLLARGRDTCTS